MITVRHPRFKFALNKHKFYQIIELDLLQNKKVYSVIFKGIDYLDPDQLADFEKQFPPREKHITDTQLKM